MAASLLLLACPCAAICVAAFGGGLLYLKLRCGSCGRLPLASRDDSGWPDFSAGTCPYCGTPRR
ncbi:MAG: hypothetical protein U0166_16480 [Acidobacteriota bacterium]